jgi:hypothetical protein
MRGARDRNGVTCLGHLQVGLSMALLAAGQPVITTRVYSIVVERADAGDHQAAVRVCAS